MRTNRELALAIKRALATGTIALCGAGAMAAYAQPTPTATATTTQTNDQTDASRQQDDAEGQDEGGSREGAHRARPDHPGCRPPRPAPQSAADDRHHRLADRADRHRVAEPGAGDQRQGSASSPAIPTSSDVLRNISANGASTLSQSFSFAFAAGASGISLRGLVAGRYAGADRRRALSALPAAR